MDTRAHVIQTYSLHTGVKWPRVLGWCGCVATAGPPSCVYLEVDVCVAGGRGWLQSEGVSGPGYPQPCFLLLLASFHLCPWRTRRPRVTSCTCAHGTLSVTGWSTNPWLLIPISRLVSPVNQDWGPLLLWASWLGLWGLAAACPCVSTCISGLSVKL